KNIAYKACGLVCNELGIKPDFEIHIKKVLPTQAGMGGGSADAAGVLVGIKRGLTGVFVEGFGIFTTKNFDYKALENKLLKAGYIWRISPKY
ncbi:MAG: hypothetical protein RR332_06725, partial [Clostridiales bacterium]